MSEHGTRLIPCAECDYGNPPGTSFCAECGLDLRPRSLWRRLLRRPAERAPRSLREQAQRIADDEQRIADDIARFERQRDEVAAQLAAAQAAGRPTAALETAAESLVQALEQRRSLLPRYRALARELVLDRATNELRLLLTDIEGQATDASRLRRALEGELTATGSLLDAGTKLNALALAPDGRSLACAADGGTLRLWTLPDPRPQATLVGHTTPLRALAFDSTGQVLASGGLDRTICLWSLDGGANAAKAEPQRLSGHGDWISSLAFAPTPTKGAPTLLASGSGDGTTRLWPLAGSNTGPQRKSESLILARGSQLVRAVAFSPDGKLLAIARLSGPIELWDVGARSPVGQADLGAGFGAIRFSPNGALLASCGEKSLRLWSLPQSRVVAEQPLGSIAADLCFGANGRLLLAALADGTLRLFALEGAMDAPALREVGRHAAHRGAARQLVVGGDGRFVVSSGDDATLRLWDFDQPSIARLARRAVSWLDELMCDVELARSEEGRQVGKRAWRYLEELAAALAYVQSRRLHALPLVADDEQEHAALRLRIAALLDELEPFVRSLYPRAGQALPGALAKLLDDLPRRLLAALVDTLLVTVQEQLKDLHGADEASCTERLRYLRGASALATELDKALAAVPSLSDARALVARTAAQLPELTDLVLARRATAALRHVSPLDDDAPLAALAAERSALQAGAVEGAELAAALAEVEAFLSGEARADELAERELALAAIEQEATQLKHAQGAIDEVERLLRE